MKRRKPCPSPLPPSLSVAEARLILAGKQAREVAADLEVSAATVKWHLTNVYAKTDTTSVADLLRLAWGVEIR